MSNTRNFRISINLCQWFNDHRHIARIFINDDINTIGDLEKRIENIFKIKNFHLTSRNEYLPSSEDVRILQKDDVVWVMRNNYEQESTLKITPAIISSTENIFKSNKRMISITEDSTEQDSHPAKRKKKKKRKQEENEDVKESSPSEEPKKKKKHRDNGNCTTKDEVSGEQIKHKHKKIKKFISSTSNDHITSSISEKESGTASESSSLNINKLLPVLQSHIDSYNKKKSNKVNETALTSNSFGTSQIDEQSELCNDNKEPYKCKGSLSSYKRRVTVPTITDKYLQEKKVNIVKIEYLSGKPPHVRELELTKNNGVIDNENQSNLTKNVDSDMNEHSIAFPPKIDLICNSESQTDQNTSKLKHVEEPSVENRASTDFKLVSVLDKSDISYSKISNSPKTAQEQMEICSNETEVLQIENNGVNNVPSDKDEVIEINKSLVINSNELLNKSIEVTESSQGKSSPFQALTDVFNGLKSFNKTRDISRTALDIKQNLLLNKYALSLSSTDLSSKEKDMSYQTTPETSKLYLEGSSLKRKINEVLINMSNEILNVNKPIEVTKSVLSNSTDLSSKEKDISCLTTPETSKDYVERNSSPEKIINESLATIESEAENTNLKVTGGDVSVCDQSINFMDDSSKKLQLPDTSDLNNCANKTDELNENICQISQKESTDNQHVNVAIIDLSDNSKQSDMDLTEDVLDTSILSHGNSSFRRRKHLAGIGQFLGELRSNESLVTGESMDSDYSEFVTKRKRKRVRKKKNKNNQDTNTSLNDSSIIATTDHIPKPIRTQAFPNLHLKFAEEDGDVVKVIDVTKKETEDSESYMAASSIENITIDSDADQPHAENFNIKEEYILKSPSIKYLLPKVGDIIAFKILRITENYTPEVSSYIIGKVIDFNNENKIVLYEILNGLEQCKDPQGILSLEETDKNSDNNNREFAWSDILDPRLLFP